MLARQIARIAGITAAVALCALARGAPVTDVCTYQGFLQDGGVAANDDYDFEFTVYDADIGGAVVSGPVIRLGVSVESGLFTEKLQFPGPNVFNGERRWLEVGVRRTSGGGPYTALLPRQEFTAAPYAVTALGIRFPFAATVNTPTAAFAVTQTGMQEAGVFEINNPASMQEALSAFTDGGGVALKATNGGMGGAGFFDVLLPNSGSPAIEVTNFGLGIAGLFQIPNDNNDAAAVESWTTGIGPAGRFTVSNQQSPSPALIATTNGVGPAAQFDGDLIVNDNAVIGSPAGSPTERLHVVGNVEAGRFISTVADGVMPLGVSSTTRVNNLNADMLDSLHASSFGRKSLAVLPPGGGTALLAIPHYNPAQITVGDLAGSPDEVGFLHVAENDGVVAYIGFDGSGVMVRGTASLGSTTTILTLKAGSIRIETPGDGSKNLVLASDSRDCRAIAVW